MLALRRDAAQAGDDLWLTGSIGDAAAALALDASTRPVDPYLHARLQRPTPRVAAGLALRGLAHGCIDVSEDRKSVGSGKSVSVRVELGGRRTIKKNKTRYIGRKNDITKTTE